MPDQVGFLVTADAFRRARAAPTAPPSRGDNGTPPMTQAVELTSLSLDDGRYPGQWVQLNADTGDWDVMAEVWVIGINDDTLALDTRYLARQYGYANDRLVFVAVNTGSSFSGARVQHSITQNSVSLGALAFDSESYDTDSYHDKATNNSRLTIPATGYYMFGAQISTSFSTINQEVTLYIRLNNSQVLCENFFLAGAASSPDRPLSTISVAHLSASDYIEACVNVVRSVVHLTHFPLFWIHRIG